MSQSRKFCYTVINKPWWGKNLPALLNNEGGLPGMKVHALMSIIEHRITPIIDKEDIVVGLKAYGRYLRQEYGSSKLSILPLDEKTISHFRISEGGLVQPFGEAVPPSQERLYSLYETLDAKKTIPPGQDVSASENKYLGDVLRYLTLTVEELEFFRYYTSVKDITEASALMGLSYKEGFRIYDRVKHRAARHNLGTGG
jgi:hypothetical protein